MSTSVCWELTCDGLMYCPGKVKTLIRLTLQKLEISAGSMGHLACKGFSFLATVNTNKSFRNWCRYAIEKLKQWAGMVGTVSKISAFRPKGPQFDPRLCWELTGDGLVSSLGGVKDYISA